MAEHVANLIGFPRDRADAGVAGNTQTVIQRGAGYGGSVLVSGTKTSAETEAEVVEVSGGGDKVRSVPELLRI